MATPLDFEITVLTELHTNPTLSLGTGYRIFR